MSDPDSASPVTLGELLDRTVAVHGDRPAVIDSRRTLTWRQMAGLADGIAARLRSAGVGRGDRVAVWLPNSAEYLALVFAVARLGAILVHVNSRYRAHEIGSLLGRTTPLVLVTDFGGPGDFDEVLVQVSAAHLASLRQILVRGESPSTARGATTSTARGGMPSTARDATTATALGGIPVEALRPEGSIVDVAKPEDACAIFTTTGSTGQPKLALHGQRGLAAHFAHSGRRLGFDRPNAMLLANLPFCGVGGHTWAMMAAAAGAGIVLQDSADISGLIRRRSITHMTGFADVLSWVVDAARGRPYESMQVFGIAASPFVDNDAVFAAASALGMTLRPAYGSTEANNSFAVGPDAWGTTPGGTPTHPSSRFAIRDPDTGRDMPEGEPGALYISGPPLFLGYYNDPAATKAAWTEDGMFRTGDRAYRRGDGIVFLGRYDETIRLAGFLVDPAEIETFLRLLPGVAAARVVGANSGAGARAVAFVLARPGSVPDEAAMLEMCREQIAGFKVPARIVTLDAFPVSEGANARKIRLDVLRDMAAKLLRDDAG